MFYHNSDEPKPSEKKEEEPGSRPLKRHQLRTCEVELTIASNYYHAYLTSELHSPQEEPRTLWEVYCGGARTSSNASSLGMVTQCFDLSTGWNFDLLEHQEAFKEKLRAEQPHEVLLAPTCAPWSQVPDAEPCCSDRRTTT